VNQTLVICIQRIYLVIGLVSMRANLMASDDLLLKREGVRIIKVKFW
jgi:hypothetical protein